MIITGEWYLCHDGLTRPVVRAEVRAAPGSMVKAPLLVDTGADRRRAEGASTLNPPPLTELFAEEGSRSTTPVWQLLASLLSPPLLPLPATGEG
jgi:hypothetical protein